MGPQFEPDPELEVEPDPDDPEDELEEPDPVLPVFEFDDGVVVDEDELELVPEFPVDAAPVVATTPRAVAIADEALKAWHAWEAKPGRKGSV